MDVDDDAIKIVRSASPSCTHAYLVSARGAEQLLRWSIPYLMPVDYLIALLGRTCKLNLYSTTPPLFTQQLGGKQHDTNPKPECDPEEYAVLRLGSVRSADYNALQAIRSAKNFLGGALHRWHNPQELPRCSEARWDMAKHCAMYGGGPQPPTPTAAEGRLLALMDRHSLRGAVIWEARVDDDLFLTHDYIHDAIHTALRAAFEASPTRRHLCWLPTPADCMHDPPPSWPLRASLWMASPKHMVYTPDPALNTLPIYHTSRYIFHELVPPRFQALLCDGAAVRWVVRGNDGNQPPLEAEHFELRRRTACSKLTCRFPGTLVAPWGTSLSAATARRRDAAVRRAAIAESHPRRVNFVGTLWGCNEAEFCAFAAGCHSAGIAVHRYGFVGTPSTITGVGRSGESGKEGKAPGLEECAKHFTDHGGKRIDEEAVAKLYAESLFMPALQGRCHLIAPDIYVADRQLDAAASNGLPVVTNNPLVAAEFNLTYAAARDMCTAPASPAHARRQIIENHTYAARLADLLDLMAVKAHQSTARRDPECRAQPKRQHADV